METQTSTLARTQSTVSRGVKHRLDPLKSPVVRLAWAFGMTEGAVSSTKMPITMTQVTPRMSARPIDHGVNGLSHDREGHQRDRDSHQRDHETH